MHSTLDICIISASNLSTVENGANVCVVAWLIDSADGFPAKQSTNFASARYNNPTWNFPVQFAVSDLIAPIFCQVVCLQLRGYHESCRNYEEEIGEAYLPLYDLNDSRPPGTSHLVTSQIWGRLGAPIGELNLSYKLTEGNAHYRRMPTPSAPPLPRPGSPPPPESPPSQPPGRGRDFPVVAAIAAAAVLMAPQMADLLVKLQELVVAAVALGLAFFVLVGFLIFLPSLLRRLAANREGARR